LQGLQRFALALAQKPDQPTERYNYAPMHQLICFLPLPKASAARCNFSFLAAPEARAAAPLFLLEGKRC
jgi:hypothetical protein